MTLFNPAPALPALLEADLDTLTTDDARLIALLRHRAVVEAVDGHALRPAHDGACPTVPPFFVADVTEDAFACNPFDGSRRGQILALEHARGIATQADIHLLLGAIDEAHRTYRAIIEDDATLPHDTGTWTYWYNARHAVCVDARLPHGAGELTKVPTSRSYKIQRRIYHGPPFCERHDFYALLAWSAAREATNEAAFHEAVAARIDPLESLRKQAREVAPVLRLAQEARAHDGYRRTCDCADCRQHRKDKERARERAAMDAYWAKRERGRPAWMGTGDPLHTGDEMPTPPQTTFPERWAAGKGLNR